MARPDLYYTLAHRYVQVAKAYGHLSDLKDGLTPCADCGAPACEWDHRDYMKPLDVDPVCRACNQARGDGANKDVATRRPTIRQRFNTGLGVAERDARIVAMYAQGMPYAAIAAACEVGMATVTLRLRRNGVPLTRRRGRKRDEVRDAEIAAMRESGKTLQQIATRYGLTRERVRQILKRIGPANKAAA